MKTFKEFITEGKDNFESDQKKFLDFKGEFIVDLKDKKEVKANFDALTDRLADNMSKRDRLAMEADIAILKKYL